MRKIFDTLVRNVYLMLKQNQREVIWVDPDDAELWVVGVVSGYVLQDLQELIAIWERKHRGTLAHLQMLNKIRMETAAKLKKKRIIVGTDLDLPLQRMQQYVFHPCRPPRKWKIVYNSRPDLIHKTD